MKNMRFINVLSLHSNMKQELENIVEKAKKIGKDSWEFVKDNAKILGVTAVIGVGSYLAENAYGKGTLKIDNRVGNGYTSSTHITMHKVGATEGKGIYDVNFGPFYNPSGIEAKIVSLVEGYELGIDARPEDSNTPINLELSLISENEYPIDACSPNYLFCDINPLNNGSTFPGKTITLQEYNPADPNQKFPVYDVRKVETWENGIIPLPDLNGTYTSGQPIHYFTLYFDRNHADFNNDGRVDFVDFAQLANDMGKQDGNYITDISGPLGEPDGDVGIDDVKEFSANWLAECR